MDKFENLLSALSSEFMSFNEKEIDKTIHHWMEEIGVILESEVSVLFRRNQRGKLYIDNFWRKENFEKPSLYEPDKLFPYLSEAVLDGKTILVTDPEDLPDEAEKDIKNLKKMGTTSFVFLPLGTKGQIVGAFFFAYKTKKVQWETTFVQKLRFIINIFSTVIKNEQDKKQLESRLEYETLLADLSGDFLAVKISEIGDKLTFWLHKTAETLGVDRALIFKLDANNKFYMTSTWRSEQGQEIVPYDPEELFPWMTTQLRQNIAVVIPDPGAFPPEAETDKGNMKVIGALSVLVLPLIVEETMVGALAFSSAKPHFYFSEQLILRFKIISQTFASALLRQKTQRSLVEEKERLAVTLKSIGDGVITTDTDGNIIMLNVVAEKMTGWSLEEASGLPISTVFNIIDEFTGKKQISPVEEVIKTESIVTLANHTLLVDRKGNKISIADSGAPIKDSDGRTLGVVLVFRDVSMEKKREADLLKLKKLESVGLLAGGIAHDFNNILTGIMGNIDLAQLERENPEESKAFLANAAKGCRRAADLTQKLLTFSKGGSPVKENASIGELVKESIDFILHGSNIKVDWYLQEDLWTTEVDKGQINQVIQNLILNSIESMPKGGVISASCENITLSNDKRYSGDFIRITIKDTGSGISRQNMDNIFDPYFTTKETGSGLGLTIIYSIVEKHSGFINVNSVEGEGTSFLIYLPVTGSGKKEKSIEESSDKNIGSYSFLVMDDEETIRDILTIMLQQLGHTAVAVEEGKQAVEQYRRSGFDLVILDITIPGGMGGTETMEELLKIDPEVKAVISSGYANSPVISNYKTYGFCDTLTKPYLMTELKAVIKRVME